MEKFLKVCWEKDKFSGESNFNIDNDFVEGTLFFNPTQSNKKQTVKKMIEEYILSGKITDNISGLKFTLQQGCEPKIFTETIKELEQTKQIERNGELNYSSTGIHKVARYNIRICNNGKN